MAQPGRQEKWCAAQVKLRPGKTAKELDSIYERDGWFHRRLSEALRDGLVAQWPTRLCTVSGRPAATWGPPGWEQPWSQEELPL